MRLLYVLTRSDDIGGVSIHVRDLARAMQARGNDVLVAAGGSGRLQDIIEGVGLPFASIPSLTNDLDPRADVAAFQEFRSMVMEFCPDIISAHSSKAGVIGRIVGSRQNVPTIFTAHGWVFTGGSPWFIRAVGRVAERLVSSRSAAIVTVSKHDEQLGRPVVSSRIPIRTIYNSVPDLPKEVSAGGRVNTSRQVPRIVSVARLDDQKDHATLLEALSRIDYLGWELVLVGDGPLAETVKNLARESGLSDRVKFLGYCPAVADELAKSDMFVLSSHYEGLPRSIIEAMRSSLPVVATAVGGVDELVLDGVSGYLVERRDVSALASSIARLLVDPSRRRAFGTAGRERYLANHSFDMFVDRMEALYVAVLSEMQ